ncbi:TetR/AcrR family transcriptional regulator [Pseudoxanthomonas sp.]|uniref:TetR/AcrR family transcriptional regulator n=1 Tax=Pseudoxanthomonas sp. TaxID=1871049 RepID=UPI003F8021F2
MSNSTDFRGTASPRTVNSSAFLRTRRNVELCKRGEMRAERFLDAATEVFAEKGYQHAKLSEIVARAGGSLATLYRIFGDKEGLAYAILERRLENHVGILNDMNFSDLPERALREVAIRIADSMLKAESRVVYRIVIGEGESFPALRDWFFEHAVAETRGILTRYFQQEMDNGHLKLNSAEAAATQFYMMMFGNLIIRVASGYLDKLDPTALREQALANVELFLQGALPRG